MIRRFRAGTGVSTAVLPGVYGEHPDFEKIDWNTVQWLKSGRPWMPDPAKSLAAAIVAHLLNYLITGVLGIYALSTEGQTLSGVYQQLVKFRQSGQKDQ